jgi:hypothetical protein
MIHGDDCGAVSGMDEWQGKPKYSEETCPSAAPSTTEPTLDWIRTRTWTVAVGSSDKPPELRHRLEQVPSESEPQALRVY